MIVMHLTLFSALVIWVIQKQELSADAWENKDRGRAAQFSAMVVLQKAIVFCGTFYRTVDGKQIPTVKLLAVSRDPSSGHVSALTTKQLSEEEYLFTMDDYTSQVKRRVSTYMLL